jgi:hypothetical protein
MENRIKKKVDAYVQSFKTDLKDKMQDLNLLETPEGNDLLRYIYEYTRVNFTNEDFSKRKRLKNTVPISERCIAKKALGQQCTRKKKDGCNLCGTHMKGTPHGVVEVEKPEDIMQKVTLHMQCNRGIYSYTDESGKSYPMEYVLQNAK